MDLVVLSHLGPILCGEWCYLFIASYDFFVDFLLTGHHVM